jgi:hypothetical protein
MVQGAPLKQNLERAQRKTSSRGNFREPRRTKSYVQVSRLLPAGVPRGLSFLKARIFARFEGAPLFFFAVVIGIALTFRVAIGWARSASDQPVAEPIAAKTAEPRVSRSAGDGPRPDDVAPVTATPGAGTTVMPADTISSDPRAPGGIPKRKPRTHGRR